MCIGIAHWDKGKKDEMKGQTNFIFITKNKGFFKKNIPRLNATQEQQGTKKLWLRPRI